VTCKPFISWDYNPKIGDPLSMVTNLFLRRGIQIRLFLPIPLNFCRLANIQAKKQRSPVFFPCFP
jgi:hypothetical protein